MKTALAVLVIGVILGAGYYLFADPVRNFLQSRAGSTSVSLATPTPTPTIYPLVPTPIALVSPVATATPSPTPTPSSQSIATIVPTSSKLPVSGPADSLVFSGIIATTLFLGYRFLLKNIA